MSKIYQLKITLKEVKPPVWRRVEVPANMKLSDLSDLIINVMGWGGYHLTAFDFYGQEYMNDDDIFSSDRDLEGLPMSQTLLNQVLTQERVSGLFVYDFGDDWRHEVLLEKILDAAKGVHYPRCTDGKRACPPDDCGGPYGYAELLEVLKNPKHPEYEDTVDWLGEEFDAEAFDLEGVNEGL